MRIIESSLHYLKETLSAYLDEDDNENKQMYGQLLKKLEEKKYDSEEQFLNELEEVETEFLNTLLENEINYASSAQDEVRFKELNDIFVQLF